MPELAKLVIDEFKAGRKDAERSNNLSAPGWSLPSDPFDTRVLDVRCFVDREAEIARLARALGREMAKPRGPIAVIGPFGFGSSALVRVVTGAISQSGRAPGIVETGAKLLSWVDREEGDDDGEQEAYLDRLLRVTDFRKVRYVLIDEADSIARYLLDVIDRIVVTARACANDVTVCVTLTMSGWLDCPQEFKEQVSEQIWVPALSLEDVAEVLERRLQVQSSPSGLAPFDRETLNTIAAVSRGSIRLALELASRVLRECASRNLSKASSTMVASVAGSFGFDVGPRLDGWLDTEDPTKVEIVRHLVRSPSGSTGTSIAENSTLRRTTIGYHLGVLEEIAAVHRRRRGKEVLYVLSNPARSILELSLFQREHPEDA